ncbi:MAG: hypothetical protein FP815_15675 [Desulfobulbaceae bacterium]|nr:hypothetical protein [Desulfobulbaceae bacterium]
MRSMIWMGWFLLLAGCAIGVNNQKVGGVQVESRELNDLEQLGRMLFFDTALSDPEGQSCDTCHDPDVGWTGPRSDINQGGSVYPGAVHSRFGNRKPPSAAYATPKPCAVLRHGRRAFHWRHFLGWTGHWMADGRTGSGTGTETVSEPRGAQPSRPGDGRQQGVYRGLQ